MANTSRRLVLPILLFTSLLSACGQGDTPVATTTASGMPPASGANAINVVMETSLGTVRLALDAEQAPVTTANFVTYVEDEFYDGLVFHRIIDGFMVQGGGFNADMQQKAVRDPIVNESNNGLSNARGTIAMARTQAPDSATAQFYINLVDNPNLDYRNGRAGYAVFGRVVDGMEVVDQMAKVATGNRGRFQDVPVEPVLIHSVRIEP